MELSMSKASFMQDYVTTNPMESFSKDSFQMRETERQEQAIKDFETIFITLLLKKMRDTVPQSDYLHSLNGEDLYQTMFDQEIAKEISAGRGIGLGSLISRGVNQLKKYEK